MWCAWRSRASCPAEAAVCGNQEDWGQNDKENICLGKHKKETLPQFSSPIFCPHLKTLNIKILKSQLCSCWRVKVTTRRGDEKRAQNFI
jgi:hypothetical protein